MTYGNYPNLTGVKKILVVKLRQLGDVLLTSPVFHVLRKRFPNAELHAYVYRESFDMLDGQVDQLIGYDRKWKQLGFFKRMARELQLWRKIKNERYDLVINLTEGDRGALAARASRAKIRVGFKPKGKWQKKLYTHVVKDCPSLRHMVERNLDALRRIGIFPLEEERVLTMQVSEERFVEEPFVLVHPSSRWRFKCWPEDKMRELTKQLIKMGKRVVFTSGPDRVETEMVGRIVRGLDVMNLSGKVSLKQLGALIRDSEFLVCVDSVPFHMASALKSKVVAIFGPTSEVTWGPWQNPGARIVTKSMSCRPCYLDGCGGSKVSDCLATLSVHDVIEAIDSLESNKALHLEDPCFS